MVASDYDSAYPSQHNSRGRPAQGVDMDAPSAKPYCDIECIICGIQLEQALPPSPHQPYRGTSFSTGGHYGSTVFDEVDGSTLSIIVCDVCLQTAASNRRVTIVEGRQPKYAYDYWNG